MKYFKLIIFLFLFKAINAQNYSNVWPIQARDFLTDVVGNFYIINKGEITKYSNNKQLIGRYSNKQLGNDFFIDVTNPLKVIVFSPSVSTLIFLDNMLSKSTTEINLNTLELGTATLVCASSNSGFWIYNPINFQLKRFNENLQVVSEINFLNQIIQAELYPNFMMEYNNRLYLNDPQLGILVFDIYGTYFKTLPITGIKKFTIANNQLFYLLDNKLYSYQLQTLEQKFIEAPSNLLGWAVANKKIFWLFQQGIVEYKEE